METTILVPKEILLRGYNAKLHEMIQRKYTWFQLTFGPYDPWDDEAEAYYSGISVQFELIRKSKYERLKLKVDVSKGANHV